MLLLIAPGIQLLLTMCKWCRTIHWGRGDLLIFTFPKKNNSPYLYSHQMPKAPELKVLIQESLPYPHSSFDCLSLAQATTPAKWIFHQPCHVLKTALYSSSSSLLALNVPSTHSSSMFLDPWMEGGSYGTPIVWLDASNHLFSGLGPIMSLCLKQFSLQKKSGFGQGYKQHKSVGKI